MAKAQGKELNPKVARRLRETFLDEIKNHEHLKNTAKKEEPSVEVVAENDEVWEDEAEVGVIAGVVRFVSGKFEGFR